MQSAPKVEEPAVPAKRSASPPPQDMPRKRDKPAVRELTPSPPPSPEKGSGKRLNFANIRPQNTTSASTSSSSFAQGKTASTDFDLSKFKRDQPAMTPGTKVPFEGIFKDCVFTLSGYVNPKRAELKKICGDMGGSIEAEVIPEVTHVVCDSADTPKVKQLKARGGGKVVKPEWLEKCNRERRLVPDSAYLLYDGTGKKPAKAGDDADDVLIQRVMADSLKAIKQQQASGNPADSDSDFETLPARKTAGSATGSQRSPPKAANSTSPSTSPPSKTNGQSTSTDRAPSAMDDLPTFLRGCTVHFYNLQDPKQQMRLVISYDGESSKTLHPGVTHIVTDKTWNGDLEGALKKNSKVLVVTPQWLTACHQAQKRVDERGYFVKRIRV